MRIDCELKVMACIHASSTSSIQQMADICRSFAIMKSESKKITAINVPSGYGLKGEIEYKLDQLQASGVLMLKLSARKAIIDHIASCPEVYGKALQTKTTKKGFVENGIEDEYTHTYPDVFKMLITCKLVDFKQEYENLLFQNFSELYQKMKSDGHIPEETYDRLGFPPDTNYDGATVEKPYCIRQEMRHRAKVLSHDLQRSLRQKKRR